MNASEHELRTLQRMTGYEVTVTMQYEREGEPAVFDGLCVRSVAQVIGSSDKYMLVVDDANDRSVAIPLDLIATVHAD